MYGDVLACDYEKDMKRPYMKRPYMAECDGLNFCKSTSKG